uniref:Uncharacterized protein n=1 Tax=Arundo donax TaxID=35708 RepID=A0A0A9BQ76_ARUDO
MAEMRSSGPGGKRR